MKILKKTIRKQIWQRVSPWLALIAAAFFLGWGVLHLQSGVKFIRNSVKATQPGFESDFGPSNLIAESPHFRLIAYERYAETDQARVFLNQAEKQYLHLCTFLNIPVIDTEVTIFLVPQCDLSHGGINSLTIESCNNRLDSGLSQIFIHELTHTLMKDQATGQTSSFLNEGLAVTAAQRFQWGKFVPINEYEIYLFETLRMGDIIPLSDLRLGFSLNKSAPLINLKYAEAGSFVNYLINEHGNAKFRDLYASGDYEQVYGMPFEKLENNWLTSIRIGNLVIMLILSISGLSVLWTMQMAIQCGRMWIPVTITAWLAFLLWTFILSTANTPGLVYMILFDVKLLASAPDAVFQPVQVPVALLLIGLVAGLITKPNPRASGIILWVTGIGILAVFFLVPAILPVLQ